MNAVSHELHIKCLPVTSIQQNCRILYTDASSEALVVDPGGDAEQILQFLKSQNLTCKEIWLTHSHLDHCGGCKGIIEATGAPLLGHPDEHEFRARVEEITMMYGIPPGSMYNCPEPTRYISGGETLEFGGYSFEVLFTPGHSPGHLCFYQRDTENLIAGDTLFQGSIGRTDLPAGNHAELLQSIRTKILTLPNTTVVMSGHGPDTTVGREKRTNLYIQ